MSIFDRFWQASQNLRITNGDNNITGEKTRKYKTPSQSNEKQWEVDMSYTPIMLTRLSHNLLKLEHHAGFKKWADKL